MAKMEDHGLPADSGGLWNSCCSVIAALGSIVRLDRRNL